MNPRRLLVSAVAGMAVGLITSTASTVLASTATANVLPGNLSFASVPRVASAAHGQPADQMATAVLHVDVSDATGSGTGWSISLSRATPVDEWGVARPTSPTLATSASRAACDEGSTCVAAANTVGYPLAVPAGTGSAPEEIYNAQAGSGAGDQHFDVGLSVELPADPATADHSAGWTVSLNSAP